MAITQAVCDSFKKELLEGEHDFRSSGGDQFKLALYGSSASLSNTTTAYTTSQEVSASGTYSAGGGNLTSTGAAATNNTSFIDFSDISFTSASISAQAAVIYNSNTSATTNTNAAVMVLDFGAVKTSTSGTFTVQFPTNNATSAILRIT
ncbi:MAG: hypothetical protein CM15mV91_070 [uncultured marine virus]|jgi:hypothetical protein|nr:MAG: hypothetical protein CM15mV91_070 [uncultured marine virus]|tara:strand:+ start:51 stop:497 length:447 start_codon:yes stop_codon:yes gene_type:complete